jgi:hypothetical protein
MKEQQSPYEYTMPMKVLTKQRLTANILHIYKLMYKYNKHKSLIEFRPQGKSMVHLLEYDTDWPKGDGIMITLYRKLIKQVGIIDAVFALHTYEEAELYHGEMIPLHQVVGMTTLNFSFKEGKALKEGQPYQTERILDPYYTHAQYRYCTKRNEILSTTMMIVQYKVPDHVVLSNKYALHLSHYETCVKIINDNPSCFDPYDKAFILEITIPGCEDERALKLLRILAMRASAFIEGNMNPFRALGRSTEWRWRIKDEPVKYGELFEINMLRPFHENINIEWYQNQTDFPKVHSAPNTILGDWSEPMR